MANIPNLPPWLMNAGRVGGKVMGGPAGFAATAFPALHQSLNDSHFPTSVVPGRSAFGLPEPQAGAAVDIGANRSAHADTRRKAFDSMFRGNTSPEDLAAAKRDSMFAAGTDAQDAEGPAQGFGAVPSTSAPVLPPWMQGAQMTGAATGPPPATAGTARPFQDLGPAVPAQMPQEGYYGGSPATNPNLQPIGSKQPSFFEGFMGRLSKAGSKPDAALVPKLAHLFYGG